MVGQGGYESHVDSWCVMGRPPRPTRAHWVRGPPPTEIRSQNPSREGKSADATRVRRSLLPGSGHARFDRSPVALLAGLGFRVPPRDGVVRQLVPAVLFLTSAPTSSKMSVMLIGRPSSRRVSKSVRGNTTTSVFSWRSASSSPSSSQ